MNVSILAFVVFWVMRRMRFGGLLASLLTVLLCTGMRLLPTWGLRCGARC